MYSTDSYTFNIRAVMYRESFLSLHLLLFYLVHLWEKSRRERETKGSEVREGGREGRGREGERERRRGRGRSEGGKVEGRRVREKGGAKNISIKAAYLTASLPLWLTWHLV